MTDRKRSDIDWSDLRVLVELARQGSLSAAARALGVTHATVSRRIANLEHALQHPLFSRHGGRYALTAEGERILELAAPMDESAQAIGRAVAVLKPELSGPVRLTATEAVAIHILLPALPFIRKRYPGLDLELAISARNLSLAKREADIALRLGKPDSQASLVSMKLSELDYHLYGARTYVDGHQAQLYDYIGYTDELANWPEATSLDKIVGNGRVVLRLNHLSSRIAATRLGLGLALIPRAMAEHWQDLVRISKGAPLLRRDMYLLVHQDLNDVPRVRACINALAEAVAGQPAALT